MMQMTRRMMKMTNDIFDKLHLKFIKKRIVSLCLGESSRGYRPTMYVDAADNVLEKIFGNRRIASKIIDSRSYGDVASVLNKIDYEAFFEMLNIERSYKMLASMVLLRYKIDRGDMDGKNKKVINKAVNRIINDFEVKTDAAELLFDDLMAYAKGGRGRDDFSSVDLFDDDDDRHRNGRRRSYSNLFDDDEYYYDRRPSKRRDRDKDDTYDYMGNLYDDTDDVGAFEKFAEAEDRRSKNNEQRRDYRDYEEDNHQNDFDSDQFARDVASMTAAMLSKRMQAAAPVSEPAIMPEPRPKKEASNQDIVSLIGKLANHMDSQISGIHDSINDLREATKETFDDVYDRIESGMTDSVSESNTSEGNFICSSQDFLNAEISKSISKNVDN